MQASIDLSSTPIVVAANKSDLGKPEQCRAKYEVVSTVRKSWRAGYVECSAKHDWNITTVFQEMAKEVIIHKNKVARDEEEEQQKCCRMFN